MVQREGTLDYQGTKISYVKGGSGPPIVFVHGWSFNWQGWQPQLDYFEGSHTVIAYDWFGMGSSGDGGGRYRFPDLVKLLHFVIGELCGGEKPIVVGHSVGSTVALQYATEAGQSIRGAACADGALPLLRTTLFAAFFSLWTLLLGIKSIEWFIQRLFFSRKWRTGNPEGLRSWKKQWESNSPKALREWIWKWTLRKDPSPLLPRIEVPMLLGNGSKDIVCPVSAMKTLHEKIPGHPPLELVEGAAHMCYVEQPGTFNAILAPFVARLTPAGPP